MRKPQVSKPRTSAVAFTLSRRLPRLNLPRSAAAFVPPRPRPQVGKPAMAVPGRVVAEEAEGPLCGRCGHGDAHHPVRYVCDKYPHPDPLQICGCESETLEEPCGRCGHKARSHKPRHRCRACGCWGFEEE